MALFCAVVSSGAVAQDAGGSWLVNQASVTLGRTFVSTTTVPATGLPLHFGNPSSIAFNYSRLFKTRGILGLTAELPVAIYPRMNLNYNPGTNPKDIGALFVTPSLRVNFLPGESFTPWVSAGGGYGRFREAPVTLYENTNPGPTGTNTGVFQFGAGLDSWFWHRWGVRVEARDFYSGRPSLNSLETSSSRQHNYYVGVGVIRRF
jgi:hypothetical protein